MADAFYSGGAVVTIGAADVASSAGTAFTTHISNWDQSGGGTETESVKLFGGANINRRMPRDDIEVSFDFVMRGDGALLFEQLLMGSVIDGSTAVDSSMDPVEKVVYVELTEDDAGGFKSYGYNNSTCVDYTAELDAEGLASGSVTLKLAPTDPAAAANMKIVKAAASTISWA